MLLLIALVVESPPFYHKQPLGTHTLITYMPVFWTRSVYCIMFEPAHPSVLVCNPTRYILKNEMTWTQGPEEFSLFHPNQLDDSTTWNHGETSLFICPPSGNIRKSHRCDSPRLSWKTRTDCTCTSCGPCRLKMDFPCDFFHMESIIANWVSFRRSYRFPVWSRVFHECTHLNKLLA